MTDDIVTRLRMPICGNYDDDHPSWGPQPCSSCVEAADEIERLWVDRDNWMRVAKMMISQIDQDSHAAKEYWKVVRGE